MLPTSAQKLKQQLQYWQKTRNETNQAFSAERNQESVNSGNNNIQNQKRDTKTSRKLKTKASNSTLEELPELAECDINGLDLTFNKIRQSSKSHGSTRRFAHESPHALLLYSLLFNHFHLQGQQTYLPQITRIDHNIVSAIKAALQDQIELQSIRMSFADFQANSLLCLIENSSRTLPQKQASLKTIISTITNQSAKRIIASSIQNQKKVLSRPQLGPAASKSAKNLYQLGVRRDCWESDIDEFGKTFGIRMNLIENGEERRLGIKSSCVQVSIKRPRRDLRFTLKKISCFQVDHS